MFWLKLVVIKYLEIRGVTKLSRKKKLSGLDWTGSHVNTEGRTAATATNMAALVGWDGTGEKYLSRSGVGGTDNLSDV